MLRRQGCEGAHLRDELPGGKVCAGFLVAGVGIGAVSLNVSAVQRVQVNKEGFGLVFPDDFHGASVNCLLLLPPANPITDVAWELGYECAMYHTLMCICDLTGAMGLT